MEKNKDKSIDQSKIEEIKEEMIEAVQDEELNDVFSNEEEYTKVKKGDSLEKGNDSMEFNEAELDELLSDDSDSKEEDSTIKKEQTKVKKESKTKKVGFINRVIQGVIDQILNILVALLILLAVDGILHLMGLYIAQRISMFFIIYVITNILYEPILEKTKLKTTVGKRLLGR